MNLLGDELEDELQSDNPDIKAPAARIVVEPPKSAPVSLKNRYSTTKLVTCCMSHG
jgi:hypothetical protein